MKLDMIEDEFDRFFANAAMGRDLYGELVQENRRNSLPNASLVLPETNVRRTASCKCPPRRPKGSSPRSYSNSPKPPRNRPLLENDGNRYEESYVYEATLRAPSPNPSKSHSAPHSRSSSWKKSKRPRAGSKDGPEALGRPRSGSVPEDTEDLNQLERLRYLQQEDMCPVRNFTTSSKGLINRGDSFKRKSTNSVGSENGSVCTGEGPAVPAEPGNRSRVNSQGTVSTTASDNEPESTGSKVLIFGDSGVGKTALVQQFMTSEYMGASDTSFDVSDDTGEVSVSVLLDGEETMLDFIDATQEENFAQSDFDAFVLVYAITDRISFMNCVQRLVTIRQEVERPVAVILVANKGDLVRTRQITEDEAKEICLKHECKYVETSAALNHKVDELLVGIVKQIRLNPERVVRKKGSEGRERGICVKTAKGLIDKIFKRQNCVHTSCDNLLVL